MDYLDRRKRLQQHIVLWVGYVCVATGITIASLLMVEWAYGFGIGKNGTIIQSGLAYFSSQPNPATIYINGADSGQTTNTRTELPEGIYRITLARAGYHDWQRSIEIDGGSVEHFDYPLLIPDKLASKSLRSFSPAPGLMTQSPDRRWLVIQQPGSMTSFLVYDLKSPTKAPTTITLPTNLLTKATSGESWQFDEWADDDDHLLLQHLYDGKTEYILIDRSSPAQSLNLNTTLSLSATPPRLSLFNEKYDQYFLYDQTNGTLQTANLKTPAPVLLQDHVLAYQPYGDNTLLYVTDTGAPSGKVLVKLTESNKTYTIRSLIAGGNYLLDLTKYAGTFYVAAGASNEGKVYIYQDPAGQLDNLPKQAPVPTQVLHVTQPNYLSFSDNAQFIVVENASQFGVYDIENTKGYIYDSPFPVDSPAPHATWMDGDRLTYVSGGRLLIFDYDDSNPHLLTAASSSYLPAFAPDYKYVYTLAPDNGSDQTDLTQTALLTPADL